MALDDNQGNNDNFVSVIFCKSSQETADAVISKLSSKRHESQKASFTTFEAHNSAHEAKQNTNAHASYKDDEVSFHSADSNESVNKEEDQEERQPFYKRWFKKKEDNSSARNNDPKGNEAQHQEKEEQGARGAKGDRSLEKDAASVETEAGAHDECDDDLGAPIEVPADQYEEVLSQIKNEIMKGRFKNAKGNTIKNPNSALKMVKKGSVTYRQAVNVAKSGKLDALAFDIKTSAVSCSCSLGVSFAVGTALAMWRGENISNAMKTSFQNAFNSGLTSLVVSVTTNQILRTSVSQLGHSMTQNALQGLYQNQLGQQAIEKLATFSVGQTTQGMAAVAQVSKIARSNFISAAVTTVVLSTPDLYRATFHKSVSWGQVTKNFSVNAASVAGGTGGWLAGTAAGAVVGSAVPMVGTAIGGLVGGLAGAFAGGTVVGKAAKHVADKVRADDSSKMIELCKEAGVELCQDYCLNESESSAFIEHISALIGLKFLRTMYAAANTNEERKAWAYNEFVSLIANIIEARPKVSISESDIAQNALELLNADAAIIKA